MTRHYVVLNRVKTSRAARDATTGLREAAITLAFVLGAFALVAIGVKIGIALDGAA